MAIILLQTNDVAKNTIIGGNVDIDRLLPSIKACQETMIRKLLGIPLYTKMCNDYLVGGGSAGFTGLYLELYNDYIKPMVIQWTMVEYLPYASYIIGNKGLYKHGAENSQNVDKNEVDFLIEKARDTAQHYTRRFIDFMCFNSNDFPEYLSNSNNDVYPDKNADYGGWYL